MLILIFSQSLFTATQTASAWDLLSVPSLDLLDVRAGDLVRPGIAFRKLIP